MIQTYKKLIQILTILLSSFQATVGVIIPLKVKEGKNAEIEQFMVGCPEGIKKETSTIHWFAAKLDDNEYALINTYVDGDGAKAHFGGEVTKVFREKRTGEFLLF